MKKRSLRILFGVLGLVVLVGGALAFHFALKLHFHFQSGPALFDIHHNLYSHLYSYSDQTSYSPGDSVHFYVSGKPKSEIEFRLCNRKFLADEREGKEELKTEGIQLGVIFEGKIEGKCQQNNENIAEEGAGWEKSLSLKLPANMEGGWYVLELKSGEREWVNSVFVNAAATDSSAKVAYVVPTNTWNSYNPFGGRSHYSTNKAKALSFDRPCEGCNPFIEPNFSNFSVVFHSAAKDVYSLDLMDSLGIDWDIYTDEDLHRSAEWTHKYDAIMIANHSEYWTQGIWDHLHEFADSGGSLVLLSGNFGFWVTEMDLENRTQTVVKTDDKRWRHVDEEMIGILGLHTYLSSMHSYAPYYVENDTTWVTAGMDLEKYELFGWVSDIHDHSVSYNGLLKQFLFFFQKPGMGAASGLEFDIVGPYTPDNWVNVASGVNPKAFSDGAVFPEDRVIWYADGGADMGYYYHPGGGLIFNVGSVAFPGAIPYDPEIQQIVGNVLKKVLD